MNQQPYCSPPKWWPPNLKIPIVKATRGIRQRRLHKFVKFTKLRTRGLEFIQQTIDQDCGCMIASNHSAHFDSEAIYCALDRIKQPAYIMTAWQIFGNCSNWQRFLLSGIGCFSVNREGNDRQALKQAILVLRNEPHPLLIFPEGDIYHTNDRVGSFRDGMAAMALSAARKSKRPVKIVPCGAKFWYLDDPRSSLRAVLTRLENRLTLRPQNRWPLLARIARVSEAALTVKEFEHLGHRSNGTLEFRLEQLTNHILQSLEERYGKQKDEIRTPERVKGLRQTVIQVMDKEKPNRTQARSDLYRQYELAMADLFTVMQLYSYPIDYLDGNPSIERIAETVEKLEEDIDQKIMPTVHGRRIADIRFAQPVTVEPNQPTEELTARVRSEVQRMVNEANHERPRIAVG